MKPVAPVRATSGLSAEFSHVRLFSPPAFQVYREALAR